MVNPRTPVSPFYNFKPNNREKTRARIDRQLKQIERLESKKIGVVG